LVRKTNVVEEETRWAMWLYQWHNQSSHVTGGMTVLSLSASPQHSRCEHGLCSPCHVKPNIVM
jgi:hypothetical protein